MTPGGSFPSVDLLLEEESFAALLRAYPRARVVEALRSVIADVREQVTASAQVAGIDGPELYVKRVEDHLIGKDEPSLRAVINATGVVLHTNLGRAPLAAVARDAMARAARGYSNLEYDLEEGRRGSRYDHCVSLLCDLTGADDALVVNNNAAALVLALNTMARGPRCGGVARRARRDRWGFSHPRDPRAVRRDLGGGREHEPHPSRRF